MGWAWVQFWGKWLLIVLIAAFTTGSVAVLAWLGHKQPWAHVVTQRMSGWDWAAALVLAAVPWWTLLAMQIHRDMRRKAKPRQNVPTPLSVSASSIPFRA